MNCFALTMIVSSLFASSVLSQPYGEVILREKVVDWYGEEALPTPDDGFFRTSTNGFSLTTSTFYFDFDTSPLGSYETLFGPTNQAATVRITSSSSYIHLQLFNSLGQRTGFCTSAIAFSSSPAGTISCDALPVGWAIQNSTRVCGIGGPPPLQCVSTMIDFSDCGDTVAVLWDSNWPLTPDYSSAWIFNGTDTPLLIDSFEDENDSSSISAARINAIGDVALIVGSTVRIYDKSDGYSYTTVITSGLVASVDKNNFKFLDDGSLAFLGSIQLSGDPLPPPVPAFIVRFSDNTLRYFFTDASNLGACAAPFASGSEKHAIRWALNSFKDGDRNYSTICTGLDLPSVTNGFVDWDPFVVQYAADYGLFMPESYPPLDGGFDGYVSSANGVDSLGRVLIFRRIFDRESFETDHVTEYRQYVRLVPPNSCPADFDNDGEVGDSDFVIFGSEYEKLTIPPAHPICDLDFDGEVGEPDFILFVWAYNELTCP